MHFVNGVRCHLLAVTLLCFAGPGMAQRPIASAPPTDPHEIDMRELLARPVTLNVKDVPLRAAIKTIAAQSKVMIGFQGTLVDATTRTITLKVIQQPLGTVLTRVLDGTNLQVVVTGTDVIVLKPVPADAAVVSAGMITGIVRNAKTNQPVHDAAVTLDDSVKTERTNERGQYHFANVLPGSHRISVRAIGFARQVKLVTTSEEQAATVDFSLEVSVNTLDQVVVTATGEQRYRELGHVVARINADSLVQEAPITSLSELLTARVPGLRVFNYNGGVVGGEVALQMRGTTTLSLDPQPVVVVDGVRYKNTNNINGGEDRRPFNAEPRSPLNDLNVNDIETVEVVKGPSASTLYGPDAANGVIVITTKRGHAGKPQWHVYAYPDLSTMSVGSNGRLDAYPFYKGWGHIPNTSTLYVGQCTLVAQVTQQCVLDSLTVEESPVDDPKLSVLSKNRPQWHSGASLNGGTPQFLYFFSGNYDVQTGALRLSPTAERILKAQLGVNSLSNAIRTPNSQQTVNLHTNVSSNLNAKSNVTLAVNYTQATQRAMDASVFADQFNVPPFTPGRVYSASDSLTYLRVYTGATSFLSTTQQQVSRLTASLGGTLQIMPWWSANVNVGTDLDNTIDRGVVGAGVLSPNNGGQASDNHRNNTNRNVHVGTTALGHTGIWSFRTSLGTEYSYANLDGLNTQGTQLAPGSTNIGTASQQFVSRLWSETTTLGTYGEEVVGLHDRLFFTGSLRIDGSTSFGDAYSPRPFPKIGMSWVVSDEPFLAPLHQHGLDELRVRYSFGAASRYPNSAMKLGTLSVQNLPIEGTTKATFARLSLANPLLKPERTKENEYGMDATLARIFRVGLTWWNRRTNDLLQEVGAPAYFLQGVQNVGDLSAHGFESTLGVNVLQSNRVSIDLSFTYENTSNKVLSVGAGSEDQSYYGSVVVGYPLNASFGTTTIGYVDSLGGGPDGYITDYTEVLSSPVHYLGLVVAPRTYTFTPTVALFGARVRVSSLFDGQAGGIQFDLFRQGCINTYTCLSGFLKSTPLLQQAINQQNNQGDFVLSSDFTRWRELNVTADLPSSWRRPLRLSRASASFQVRNLALWTHFKSPDPESVPGFGTIAVGGGGNGASGIPDPRAWTLRFDISP